jgi:hypothetical protein
VTVEDLTRLPDAAERFTRIRHAVEGAPFRLGEEPMVRGCLVKLRTDHHVLLLTAHHIVFDGWSRSLLLRELGQVYTALQEGRDAVLPELTWQCCLPGLVGGEGRYGVNPADEALVAIRSKHRAVRHHYTAPTAAASPPGSRQRSRPGHRRRGFVRSRVVQGPGDWPNGGLSVRVEVIGTAPVNAYQRRPSS